MIALSASLSKKVPVVGVEFSSRSCSAGVEVEADSGATPQELLEKLRKLYALLEVAVDEQLQCPSQLPISAIEGKPKPSDASRPSCNGNGRKATQAQIKAIEAIARDRRIGTTELEELMRGRFGVGSASELSLKEASSVIEALKNREDQR